ARAALLILAPPPPCEQPSHDPRSHRSPHLSPRAGFVRTQPVPVCPHLAHRSAASPVASPRVRGHDASPRAHRSPPLRHLPPPRGAHASLTKSREYGDTMPPSARSPHRPCRAPPRTCTPARVQGAAPAPPSLYLHPRRLRAQAAPRGPRTRTCTPDRRHVIYRASARAWSAGLVPKSPPADWDDPRCMSARVGARAEVGTERAKTHALPRVREERRAYVPVCEPAAGT
ncbi:hypothetical protein DFH09DRAFT_1473198, partial [Mycena vulgaris]